MNDNAKATPGGAPPDPTPLAAKVGAARVAPDDPAQLRVTLHVEGGSAGDRYEFHFEATGGGDVQLQVMDRLRQVDVAPYVGETAAGVMTEVLTNLDVGQIVALSRQLPPIPPDSVVGILRVSDGEQEVSVPFMADEGQAETAGFELPPDLKKAIDTIYEISAKQLDMTSVRP